MSLLEGQRIVHGWDGMPMLVDVPPRKEDAACCQKRALADGRPVIGWCSAVCLRRPEVWAARAG